MPSDIILQDVPEHDPSPESSGPSVINMAYGAEGAQVQGTVVLNADGTVLTFGIDGKDLTGIAAIKNAIGTLSDLARDNTLLDPALVELGKVSAAWGYAARVHANLSNSISKEGQVVLPRLPVYEVTGYRGGYVRNKVITPGKPFPLKVTSIDGHLVGLYAGLDYVLMRKAANLENIDFPIGSAFRSNQEQTDLYNERAAKVARGVQNVAPVAPPTISNHQNGSALDLQVKMDLSDFEPGQTDEYGEKVFKNQTKEYRWLHKNGRTYGFSNTEGKSVREPWHWKHAENRVIGPLPKSVLSYSPDISAAAQAATANTDQLLLLLGRVIYDSLDVHKRAAYLMRTSGADFKYAAVGQSLRKMGRTNKQLADASKAIAGNEQKAQVFQSSGLNAVTYDFTAGRWLDGKSV